VKCTFKIIIINLIFVGFIQAQTIRIVSVSPLTGSQAGPGEMLKLGAQLAVEEAKPAFAELGLTLEFLPQDDEALPSVGRDVAKRIAGDPDVLAVIGHLNSGVGIPASDIYKEFNLALVSPANTAVLLTERGYGNVSRVCGRDDVQGRVNAEFAVEELKAANIYIIHDKTTFGQGLAEVFSARAGELGAKIVGFIGTVEKVNFMSLILQMRVLKPDLVYFAGEADQGAVLVKQMREKGIKSQFFGPDSLDVSEFVRVAQDATPGVYYSTYAGSLEQLPQAKIMWDAFQDKFNRVPESGAFYAYDAASLALTAIRETHAQLGRVPTREEICLAVRALSFKGITGTIEFDERGDRKRADYYINQYSEVKYPGIAIKAISATPPPGK